MRAGIRKLDILSGLEFKTMDKKEKEKDKKHRHKWEYHGNYVRYCNNCGEEEQMTLFNGWVSTEEILKSRSSD